MDGHCGINTPTEPSEVLVIADGTANLGSVAANIIAQAEHNVVACAILVTLDRGVVAAVEAKMVVQVDALQEPNRSTS